MPRIFLIAALFVSAFGGGCSFAPGFRLSPTKSFGAPLRVGNRVYQLTGQWKNVINFDDDFHRDTPADLFVDLWAFDAATAQPVYRRRLQTIRNGAMDGRKILGAHGQTLWLLLPTGVHAVNLGTGALTATPESIGKINPNLRGLMPVDARFHFFTNTGLSIKTEDARTWHIHPETFAASETPPPVAAPGIVPGYITPQSSSAFVSRGFTLGNKWLGLLNAEEAEAFAKTRAIGGLDFQTRRSVYAADITKQETFMGATPSYSNFRALTQDFLAPGILSEHRSTGPYEMIYRRNPDSVFVLHLDRLGENGQLQLARVTGPAGKILWNVPVRLSVLQCLMPDEQNFLLYGVLFTPQDPAAPVRRDPMHTAREMLVSVDVASGAIRYHDQSDTSRHPEATSAQ